VRLRPSFQAAPGLTLEVLAGLANYTDDQDPGSVIPTSSLTVAYMQYDVPGAGAANNTVYGWRHWNTPVTAARGLYVGASLEVGISNDVGANPAAQLDVAATIYLMTTNWDPETLTWGSQPAFSGPNVRQQLSLNDEDLTAGPGTLGYARSSFLFTPAEGVTYYGFGIQIDGGSLFAEQCSAYIQFRDYLNGHLLKRR